MAPALGPRVLAVLPGVVHARGGDRFHHLSVRLPGAAGRLPNQAGADRVTDLHAEPARPHVAVRQRRRRGARSAGLVDDVPPHRPPLLGRRGAGAAARGGAGGLGRHAADRGPRREEVGFAGGAGGDRPALDLLLLQRDPQAGLELARRQRRSLRDPSGSAGDLVRGLASPLDVAQLRARAHLQRARHRGDVAGAAALAVRGAPLPPHGDRPGGRSAPGLRRLPEPGQLRPGDDRLRALLHAGRGLGRAGTLVGAEREARRSGGAHPAAADVDHRKSGGAAHARALAARGRAGARRSRPCAGGCRPRAS